MGLCLSQGCGSLGRRRSSSDHRIADITGILLYETSTRLALLGRAWSRTCTGLTLVQCRVIIAAGYRKGRSTSTRIVATVTTLHLNGFSLALICLSREVPKTLKGTFLDLGWREALTAATIEVVRIQATLGRECGAADIPLIRAQARINISTVTISSSIFSTRIPTTRRCWDRITSSASRASEQLVGVIRAGLGELPTTGVAGASACTVHTFVISWVDYTAILSWATFSVDGCLTWALTFVKSFPIQTTPVRESLAAYLQQLKQVSLINTRYC
ncbi:MAG: hypothetical protein J3R72DRAFT_210659 [Linnemannia gamsii]|nr:MAG: hypothetical protein J3R72DRAFT_210659 [Linnemannia gamsii]